MVTVQMAGASCPARPDKKHRMSNSTPPKLLLKLCINKCGRVIPFSIPSKYQHRRQQRQNPDLGKGPVKSIFPAMLLFIRNQPQNCHSRRQYRQICREQAYASDPFSRKQPHIPGKHIGENPPGHFKGVRSEQNKSGPYQHKGSCSLEKNPKGMILPDPGVFIKFLCRRLCCQGKAHQNPMVQAGADNKSPFSAMPKPQQKPDNEKGPYDRNLFSLLFSKPFFPQAPRL